MNHSYPVMLQLCGKKVTVVGGGSVAERKVTGLLESGADVTVISPEATTTLSGLASAGRLKWLQRNFSPEDAFDAFMVIAATNDKDVNIAVKNAAGENRLVLLADDPEQSNFHVPAVVQRGRLCIAVSTNGASPTLAKTIRNQLSSEFDEGYEPYLDFLFRARELILQEVSDPSHKKKLLKLLVAERYLTSGDREKDFETLLDQIRNQ